MFLISFVSALSYVCDYPEFELGKTHYLYKEEVLPVVKWLAAFEYCRAKGDSSVYADAGQPKCEYSRGICFWAVEGRATGCYETFRENDSIEECRALLAENELSFELDNGRLPTTVSAPPTMDPPTNTTDVSSASTLHVHWIVLILMNLV
jgi:hypothetical protein